MQSSARFSANTPAFPSLFLTLWSIALYRDSLPLAVRGFPDLVVSELLILFSACTALFSVAQFISFLKRGKANLMYHFMYLRRKLSVPSNSGLGNLLWDHLTHYFKMGAYYRLIRLFLVCLVKCKLDFYFFFLAESTERIYKRGPISPCYAAKS